MPSGVQKLRKNIELPSGIQDGVLRGGHGARRGDRSAIVGDLQPTAAAAAADRTAVQAAGLLRARRPPRLPPPRLLERSERARRRSPSRSYVHLRVTVVRRDFPGANAAEFGNAGAAMVQGGV